MFQPCTRFDTITSFSNTESVCDLKHLRFMALPRFGGCSDLALHLIQYVTQNKLSLGLFCRLL